MNKKLILISLLISNTAMAEKLPDFLDSADIENASFVCLGETPDYSKQDQKYVDILWDETLRYLNGFAKVIRTANTGHATKQHSLVRSFLD
jgi:hypothetical protein